MTEDVTTRSKAKAARQKRGLGQRTGHLTAGLVAEDEIGSDGGAKVEAEKKRNGDSIPVPSGSDPKGCARYDELADRICRREASEEEARFLLAHESTCKGVHSAAHLEKSLGLPKGALEHGSAAHGVRSAAQLAADIRRRL